MSIPVLLVTTPVGLGKTTVALEASDVLEATGVAHAVIDVDARWRVAHDWEIFASIVNVLDRRYQNFAVLGANAFTGPDRSFGPALGLDPAPEQFRAVGAPRGIWIGVRYAFGSDHAAIDR